MDLSGTPTFYRFPNDVNTLQTFEYHENIPLPKVDFIVTFVLRINLKIY